MNATRGLRAIAVCLALSLGSPAAALAARPHGLGFSDGAYSGPNAATWLQRSAAAGAGIVRIDIGWDAPNTPVPPRGFNPRNPADPNYNFTQADASIRLANQMGLQVLAQFTGAPQWADGPGRPADVPPGTWRPSPQALEDYAVALGRRYSGHFPDPDHPGHMLPRVAAFQVWNEPNLNAYLNPQWSGNHAASPTIYRAMLNAFYRGLKSVDPTALVVTAGTAPFGDPEPGGARIMPARFWRDVLCIREASGGALRGEKCSNPAHFDVLAHNMYSWGSPETHALWPDDVAIPDMGKLTAILRAAERAGTALPREHHPLWVTEVGYNSKPPNPYGVPVATQARWLEQTLAVLWREDVSDVFWEQVGDQPPIPSYSATNNSGVYYLDGQPKPALKAFQFPLVAWNVGRSAIEIWGRSPATGRVYIELADGDGWRTVGALSVRAGATFEAEMAHAGKARLRASIAGRVSLVWSMS